MRRSQNGRLIVWDQPTDPYEYTDLLANADWLDKIIGNPGDGTGTPGSSAARKADITGVYASWLGPGDSTMVTSGASGDTGTTRTLYSIISGLVQNSVPLGTVISWWRPSATVGIPAGWVVCDGSTLPNTQHSWSGAGTITLPDLRNKFILGANVAKADGTGSVAGDGATNAPGIRYDSASLGTLTAKNAKRDLTHTHGPGTYGSGAHTHDLSNHIHVVTTHTHTIQPHVHDMHHLHAIPEHTHQSTDPVVRASLSTQNVAHAGQINVTAVATGTLVSTSSHTHDTYVISNPQLGTGRRYGGSTAFWDVGNTSSYFNGTGLFYKDDALTSYAMIKHDLNVVGGNYDLKMNTGSSGVQVTDATGGTPTGGPSANITGSATAVITGTSSSSTFNVANDVSANLIDVRPAHVGLLYIMKVKKVFNLINNDRVLFDSSIT